MHDIISRNTAVDKQIKIKQLITVDVVGDGNCFFRFVAMSVYGCQSRHSQLRAAVALSMLSMMGDGCQHTDDVLAYRRRVDEISKDGNYAGEEAILATAKYLQRSICVFMASDTASPLTYSPPVSVTTTNGGSNHIAFHEPGHYLAVSKMRPHCSFTSSTAKNSTSLN